MEIESASLDQNRDRKQAQNDERGFDRWPNSQAKQSRTQTDRVLGDMRAKETARVATEMQLGGKHRLLMLWSEILSDYENEELHGEFVRQCFEMSSLAFAAHKYATILEIAPTETMAADMQRRIQALVALRSDFAAPSLREASDKWLLFNFRVPLLNHILIVMGSMVLTTGLLLPHAQEMVPIGMLALAIGFTMRMFSKAS